MHTTNEAQRSHRILRVARLGTIVNALLAINKLIVGIMGHSAALIADAVNSLSDLIADIIMLICLRISMRPIDEDHRYGHGKFETLATAFVSIIMIIVGSLLAWESVIVVWRILVEGYTPPTPSDITLWVAGGSILAKDLLCRFTIREAKHCESSVLHAKALDHRSDALMSLGVLVGVIGARFLGAGWLILDPLVATIVSLFIVRVGVLIVLPAVNELTEVSLSVHVVNQIEAIVLAVEGVEGIRNLNTRSVGRRYAIEMDILVCSDISVAAGHDITMEVEQSLREVYGDGTHVVVHVEPCKRHHQQDRCCHQ